MRVMLITPISLVKPDCKNAPRPEVGDIDIVTDEKGAPGIGLFYSLERFGIDLYYLADLFAVLPDSEPEAVTEEETLLQTA